MIYEPCECCGRRDLDTGNAMCGFGWECVPCLGNSLTGDNTWEHDRRHVGPAKALALAVIRVVALKRRRVTA